MKKLLLFLCFAFATPAFGQNVAYFTKIVNDNGTPIAYPLVTVCTSAASLIQQPCLGHASVYSSIGTPLVNPFRGDKDGNIEFYAAAANYVVSIGSPFNPGYSFKISLSAGGGGAGCGTLTGNVTSSGCVTTIANNVVSEAMQSLANNTTGNATTSRHGYLPILPNSAVEYLDGTGAFTIPPKVGTGARSFYATDYGVTANTNYSCVAVFTSGSKTVTTSDGTATITNTSLTTNLATYTAANAYLAGNTITITGTTNGSGIFNVTSQLIVSANSTSFTVAITHANVGSAADTGTAQGQAVDIAFDPVLDATDAYYITNGPCAGFFGGSENNTLKGSGHFTSASGHTAQMDSNATATCNGSIVSGNSCVLVWARHMDTTGLQNAFLATTANGICGTLILPAGNIAIDAPIVSPDSDCGSSQGLAASMTVNGYTVKGQGIGQTLIIPFPAFDAAGGVGANHSVIFGSNAVQGITFQDFGIFGGGNTNITNGTNKCMLNIGWLSTVENVLVTDWGNTNSGSGIVSLCGSASNGGPSYVQNFLDYNGGYNCIILGEYINIHNAQCLTFGGSYFYFGEVWSSHSFYGNGIGGGGAAVTLLSNLGLWHSDHDWILSGANQYGIDEQGSGTDAIIDDLHLFGGGSGAVGGGIKIEGGKIHLLNSTLDTSQFAGVPVTSSTAGSKFFDLGGNSVASGSLAFGTSNISYFLSNSETGTALATGNIALTSGWDTSTKSAISGSSTLGQFTITAAGTPTANPVFTITFPTTSFPFPVAPICSAKQAGGTQANSVITTGTVSTTTAAFTVVTTPIAANTLVIQYSCSLP